MAMAMMVLSDGREPQPSERRRRILEGLRETDRILGDTDMNARRLMEELEEMNTKLRRLNRFIPEYDREEA